MNRKKIYKNFIKNNCKNEIFVELNKSNYLSYNDNNRPHYKIYIARNPLGDTDKDFMLTVKKSLPKEFKYLVDIIPELVWSFLHEIGHIEKGNAINDDFIRGIANYCGSKGWSFLGNLIYFNLREEKQATKWATDYVINNLEVVIKFTNDLAKTYGGKLQTIELEEC
jgi:hypothetical protein